MMPAVLWWSTVLGILALLAFDYFFHVRRAHVPGLSEAAVWSSIYVGIALLFGVGVLIFGGGAMGAEYFAGYVTEKALSIDNLFVFLVIMTSFRVPRADQQKVLLFGITISLIVRTAFIFLGATLINTFAWVFYVFGVVLLMTAGNIVTHRDSDERSADNVMVRLARRLFPTSDVYDGDKLFTVVDGRRVMTPMVLVMAAIGSTDILFALDSIPAIFGLTQNTYVVFTATAFSLLGLRQLYFLLNGLLDRLVYLSFGLAAILAFIGVKLILHALHENNVPFINDGEPVPVVEISTGVSLVVIIGVLVVTVIASLTSAKGRAVNLVAAARRHATEYLTCETDPAVREDIFQKLLAEEAQLRRLPEKYRARIREEEKLMALLRRAHADHEAAAVAGRRSSG
ncbi:TerC/Alx family metal homeostasis membrane protein [Pseudonocardia hierapolitana]|nr:TerC/Alx family metal homeostasis membrane protein [Pseudonocardia hierapolitana]